MVLCTMHRTCMQTENSCINSGNGLATTAKVRAYSTLSYSLHVGHCEVKFTYSRSTLSMCSYTLSYSSSACCILAIVK